MNRLYDYIDVTHNTRFLVIILTIAIFLFGILAYSLRTKSPKPAQEVHVTEEILTVQMNPSVLTKALKERAADWCNVKRTIPIFGDIVISSTKNGEATFNKVFLTDSVAPAMADEYPHLFQYEEDGGCCSFTMSASRTSVTVPVWLVKSLIDVGILQLPKENQ